MGENEQGGMLRIVVVVGLVALIAAVITMGVVGMKASMTKNTDSAVGAIAKGQQVGGRNLYLNSRLLTNGYSLNQTNVTLESFDNTTKMWHITSPKISSGSTGIFFWQDHNVSNLITKGQQWAFSFDIKGTGVYSVFGIEGSTPFNLPSGNVPKDWTRVSSTGTSNGSHAIVIYFNTTDTPLDVYIKLPKLETGNKPSDWTPAPEDQI